MSDNVLSEDDNERSPSVRMNMEVLAWVIVGSKEGLWSVRSQDSISSSGASLLSPSSMLPYCLTDQAISLSAVLVCLT